MPKNILAALLAGVLILTPASSVQAKETTTNYFFATYEETDGAVTKYYPLPGGTTAVRKGPPGGGELSYLHSDHLSSTRLMTNDPASNGGQAGYSQIDYYPYGTIFPPKADPTSAGNSLTDRLYTSQILDDSTDLYFYNSRQYNPRTAAFISADSAQGPNRYAYVGGNPISRNDPSGEVAIGGATGDEAGGGQNPWGVPWSSTAGWGGKTSPTSLEDEIQMGKSFRFLAEAGAMVSGATPLLTAISGYQAITGKDFVEQSRLSGISRGISAVGFAIGAYPYIRSAYQQISDFLINPELEKAIKLAQNGQYSEAVQEAESIGRQALPKFGGFEYVSSPKIRYGQYSWWDDAIILNPNNNPQRMAQAAIHEINHLLDVQYARTSFWRIEYGTTDVQLAQSAILSEVKSYITGLQSGLSFDEFITGLKYSITSYSHLKNTTPLKLILTSLGVGKF